MPSLKRLTLPSWCLYDFGNTIFSGIVLTVYFPLHLTSLTGQNWQLGAATTGAMILAGLAVPVLGTLSDQTGKTKRYLIWTSLITITLMSLLSVLKNTKFLITAFMAACFFYHASLVFYNTLLPQAAPPEKQGFASGLGVGLGYLGVVVSLPLMRLVETHFSQAAVFFAGAVLFLVFSIPLFLWVPERSVKNPVRFRWSLLVKEHRLLIQTVRSLPQYPALAFFLIGNFLVVDAVNSMILWVAVFARATFLPGQDKIIAFLMALNASAFVAGILTGWLTDRIGAKKIMISSAILMSGTLIGIALMPSFKAFFILGVTGGSTAIAGIWTAGRKVLIELAPKEQLGRYFGLYGLTTKVSILGSLSFALMADWVGFRLGLIALILPAIIGTVFLIVGLRRKS